jgi:hypothetical protein
VKVKHCAACGVEIIVQYRNGNQKYCETHRPKHHGKVKVRGRMKWPVLVLQPGCGEWDGYFRTDFEEWQRKGAFPKGTQYILKGKPGVI